MGSCSSASPKRETQTSSKHDNSSLSPDVQELITLINKNTEVAKHLLKNHKFDAKFYLDLMTPAEIKVMTGGQSIPLSDLAQALRGQETTIENTIKVETAKKYRIAFKEKSEFLKLKEESDNLKTNKPHQYNTIRSNKSGMIYFTALDQVVVMEEFESFTRSNTIKKITEVKESLKKVTGHLENFENGGLQDCVRVYQSVSDEMDIMFATLHE